MKKNMRARTPAEIPKLAVLSSNRRGQSRGSDFSRPTLSIELTQDHLEQRLPELLVPPEVGHTHHGVEPAEGLHRILQ